MTQFQSIESVFAALRRRAWIIILVTVVGCALSVWVALNQDKAYEATAVVQIEEARVPERLTGGAAQNADAARRVRLIEQRLMSRDNLMRIMEEHDLFTDAPEMTMNERVYQMRMAARIEEIRSNSGSFQASQEVPSGLTITVRLGDPQKAADVANELMTTVIEQSRSRSASSARDTLEFFEKEEARIGAEISEQESRLADFKRANAEALPGGITSLRSQLVTLEENELELDREIVALRTNSARQREDVLDRQVALLQEQKALIAQRSETIRDTLRRAPDVERELNEMERQLGSLQEQYSVITRRKAEAEMGSMLEDREQTDRFEVLETALVPEVPASQSRRKLAMAGGVASLLAGLGIAFLAELMNPAIRSAAQMERSLGIQPVIAVPVIRSRGHHRRRGLGLLALVALLAGAVWAGLRFVGDLGPLQGLLERILPRSVQSS
ncbi:GumC family protein [Salipiger mucosus]|uniref:Polysaccharide chain length determinant N-terminal domain-containing protein n=1 Tax=Salipiger mucosus DSM 16094 TaxID=1123237 RepID=S9QRP2_9RHOB|nr:Wzz/FepE/Etk N-terminal domain-containing protein [Salipiger mucosus]EPX82307.1 hypothetical protein Salmuc_04032 [Salipiger mucosus DSM 16094]